VIAMDARAHHDHDQLLDLLGARLQFEHTAVQLYDALLAKLTALGEPACGPTHTDLAEIRNDELAHMRMLAAHIGDLGGEPAAITPAANRETIASRGIGDVVTDAASTVLDGLEAMVIAELTDHEQWTGLIELVRELGREDLARSFLTAQSTEHTHLSKMRAWISAGRAANRGVQ
jgi:rubrerythrin